MLLFPAIDLRRGRCVRLEQGAADRETLYDTDPFRVADEFSRAGAEWIHVVDLDAAFGEGSNRALIAELARAVPVKIQMGGGLRSEADLEEVLDGPIERAVLGTAAVERPELVGWAVSRWGPERIAVGLDARGRRPAVRGWAESSAVDLLDLGRTLVAQGARTLIYTDIDRDGMLAGPNFAMAGELADATRADVIVSGGVGGEADIEALMDAARARPRIIGAIVGKAIYEGRVRLSEAVRLTAG